jgi:MFS family permease
MKAAGPGQRLRSLAALNGVSLLSQIGQYGMAATLLPLALEVRGASAAQIGVASAAYWLGMFGGLLLAGPLSRGQGYRRTVLAGLLLSAFGFMIAPTLPWALWAAPAALIGMGLGLRWIANETWLYRLAPEQGRGRVVGLHETVIALASIVGPLLVAGFGVTSALAFWWGAALTLCAAPALWGAETLAVPPLDAHRAIRHAEGRLPWRARGSLLGLLSMISLGAWLAGLGGWIEGALLGLMPVFAADHGLASADTALLMALLGVGGVLFQFPIGWLADLRGVAWAARWATAFAGTITLLTLGWAAGLWGDGTAGSAAWALGALAVVIGGVSPGLLTLGLTHATQDPRGAAITAQVRQVSLVYTLLSAAGPLAAGSLIEATGSSLALLWQQLAVVGLLAVLLLRPHGRVGQAVA